MLILDARGDMMKYNLLLVSHSQKVTDGLKELIEEMNISEDTKIYSLGGTRDGGIGSDVTRITDIIEASDSDTHFLAFADLGSAVLNVEMALDLINDEQKQRYHLIDVPLIEGAFAAAITVGVTDDLNTIITEAKKTVADKWY
jgi:dihydroxyacetone kinase phosphotransfer subunit